MNLTDLSLQEYVSALRRGKFTVRDAVAEYIDRIDKTAELNNFITVCRESALKTAGEIDSRIAASAANIERMPLLGVPIAVKDNIAVKNERCTCASRALRNYIPDHDAEVVKRLTSVGAIIIGKTNMDEFAMGSSTENSIVGAVRNALDRSRSAGGSSGGSANCVAARQAIAALGSDTGGSVRQPAAFCGVVGLKPTYSSISRRGLSALVPSLDQIGIFGRDCDDVFAVFCAVRENGARLDHAPLNASVFGKKIGIAKQFLNVAGLDDGVRSEFIRAVGRFEALGAQIVETDIPAFDAALDVYHIISSAEATNSVIRKTSGLPDLDIGLLGAEVRRRLVTGAFVLGECNYDKLYIKAAKARAVIKSQYETALKTVDVLLSPTSPTVATPLGRKSDPHAVHACDKFAAAASLAGLPAVSVPFGNVCGLPIGVQIIGKLFDETGILEVGKSITMIKK